MLNKVLSVDMVAPTNDPTGTGSEVGEKLKKRRFSDRPYGSMLNKGFKRRFGMSPYGSRVNLLPQRMDAMLAACG